MRLNTAAADFLAPAHRIAVAGVSRDRPNAANVIYRRLRALNYAVFPINPAADEVEGDRCYRSLGDIAGGVDGVVVGTAPKDALAVVTACAAAGVPRVWLHRGIGEGSVSAAAVQYCEEHALSVIAGACPMMFLQPTDLGHRCLCWMLGKLGKLPDPAAYQVSASD